MRPSLAVTKRQRGFSLMELMTVVAIMAVVLGFGIPSFQEFVTNYRTSVQTNDLLSDLSIARSEAVKYARRTEVRAEGGDWTNGWIVWTDLNGDGNRDIEEIVKRHGVAEPDFTILAGDAGGNPAPIVAFGVTGTVVTPAGLLDVEFAICRPDLDPQKSRGIVLIPSGRAESQKADDNTAVNC